MPIVTMDDYMYIRSTLERSVYCPSIEHSYPKPLPVDTEDDPAAAKSDISHISCEDTEQTDHRVPSGPMKLRSSRNKPRFHSIKAKAQKPGDQKHKSKKSICLKREKNERSQSKHKKNDIGQSNNDEGHTEGRLEGQAEGGEQSHSSELMCSEAGVVPEISPGDSLKTEQSHDTQGVFAKQKRKRSHKKVTCPDCHKVLSHRGSLITHMRLHTGEKPYQCEECQRKFSVKINYKRHLLTHKTHREFKCEICGWDFLTKYLLKKHKLRHEKNRPLNARPVRKGKQICHICGKCIRSYSELQIHIRSHTGEKAFTCQHCGRGFNVKCNYRRHLLRHESTKQFECEICHRKYFEKRHLNHHMLKLHKNVNLVDKQLITSSEAAAGRPPGKDQAIYRCDHCPRKFLCEESRDKHQTTQHLPCPDCKKIFDTKGELRAHLPVHSTVRPFVCEVCLESFKTRKYLQSHELIHSNEAKHKCSYCGASFKQHQSLWRHLQFHKDTKPHACSVCGKSFAVKADRVRHERIHQKKKYRCRNCNCNFDSQEQLWSHCLQCSASQRPAFICTKCNTIFKNKVSLKNHDCLRSCWLDGSLPQPETLEGDSGPPVIITTIEPDVSIVFAREQAGTAVMNVQKESIVQADSMNLEVVELNPETIQQINELCDENHQVIVLEQGICDLDHQDSSVDQWIENKDSPQLQTVHNCIQPESQNWISQLEHPQIQQQEHLLHTQPVQQPVQQLKQQLQVQQPPQQHLQVQQELSEQSLPKQELQIQQHLQVQQLSEYHLQVQQQHEPHPVIDRVTNSNAAALAGMPAACPSVFLIKEEPD